LTTFPVACKTPDPGCSAIAPDNPPCRWGRDGNLSDTHETMKEQAAPSDRHTPGPWVLEWPHSASRTVALQGGAVCIGVFSKHPDHDKPTDGYIADVYGQTVGSQDVPVTRAEANAY